MKKKYIEIREAPHKMSIAETTMRYQVFLNGVFHDDLYYNMRGYVGTLPTPSGSRLAMPESSITAFRREAAVLNREFAALEHTSKLETGQAAGLPKPTPF